MAEGAHGARGHYPAASLQAALPAGVARLAAELGGTAGGRLHLALGGSVGRAPVAVQAPPRPRPQDVPSGNLRAA